MDGGRAGEEEVGDWWIGRCVVLEWAMLSETPDLQPIQKPKPAIRDKTHETGLVSPLGVVIASSCSPL